MTFWSLLLLLKVQYEVGNNGTVDTLLLMYNTFQYDVVYFTATNFSAQSVQLVYSVQFLGYVQ